MRASRPQKPMRRPRGPPSDYLFDLALLLAVSAYTIAAPFTKVEESFNIQATHDLLSHPFSRSLFDHVTFPGVVPRSFIPPALLAILSLPLHAIAAVLPPPPPPPAPPLAQLLVRWALGAASVAALARLRRAVAARYTRDAARLFAGIVLSQFHMVFYASRTLPNTFALVLANVSLAQRLHPRGSYYAAVVTLAVATALVRSELSILLAMTVLTQPLTSPTRLGPYFAARTVRYALGAAVAAAAASVAVDSWYWRRLCYPELEVFYFNAVLGKSSAWGTHPAHWYFSSALPRALGGALPLAVFGAASHPRDVAPALLPALLFVVVYSALPHKELRFVFYALPAFNIAAAVGLDEMRRHAMKLFRKRQRPAVVLGLAATGAACVAASAAMTAVSFAASMQNYPGGEALSRLQARELRRPCASGGVAAPDVNKVHIDVAAAMSGVTRFLERADGGSGGVRGACPGRVWEYSRAEGTDLDFARQFTHLVTEKRQVPGFRTQAVQEAYAGFEVQVWPPRITLRTEASIFVLVSNELRY
jgi:alpha-1,6-mannosyltransferase